MSKRKPPCEAQTAASLTPAAPPVAEDPIEKLLGALYVLALEGNVTAAKLYLDYTARRRGEEPAGLTAEEALKLLQSFPPAGAGEET